VIGGLRGYKFDEKGRLSQPPFFPSLTLEAALAEP
jgi:hypothetical protein